MVWLTTGLFSTSFDVVQVSVLVLRNTTYVAGYRLALQASNHAAYAIIRYTRGAHVIHSLRA